MNFNYDCPRRHAITVEEYMRMREAHVFGHEARLELIEGEIVEMGLISSAHDRPIRCTTEGKGKKANLADRSQAL
jgi:hypothetical protein